MLAGQMAMKLWLLFYSPLQLAVGSHKTKSQSMSCGQMVRTHSSSVFNGRVSPYKTESPKKVMRCLSNFKQENKTMIALNPLCFSDHGPFLSSLPVMPTEV